MPRMCARSSRKNVKIVLAIAESWRQRPSLSKPALEPENHVTCLVQQPRTDPACYALTIQYHSKPTSALCMPLITPSPFDPIDLQPIEFFARTHRTFAAFAARPRPSTLSKAAPTLLPVWQIRSQSTLALIIQPCARISRPHRFADISDRLRV